MCAHPGRGAPARAHRSLCPLPAVALVAQTFASAGCRLSRALRCEGRRRCIEGAREARCAAPPLPAPPLGHRQQRRVCEGRAAQTRKRLRTHVSCQDRSRRIGPEPPLWSTPPLKCEFFMSYFSHQFNHRVMETRALVPFNLTHSWRLCHNPSRNSGVSVALCMLGP